MPTALDAQEQGQRYADQFGGRDLAALRRLAGIEFVLNGHFGPIVDGRVLVDDSQAVFTAGNQHAVPLLVGANSDEGVNYTTLGAVDDVTARAHADSEFARIYPVDDHEAAQRSARLFVGESRFNYPVWRWARTHHETSSAPTWLYQFEQAPPLPYGDGLAQPPDGVPGYGVFHTAELPYTGDNLAMRPWAWTDTDRRLARTMADTWSRFVTDLDPNGPEMPQWKLFDGTDQAQVLHFGADISVGPAGREAALRLLDRLPRPL